jgi:hypothetical protein
MNEFICPTTGKPCEQAQATGEVLARNLLELYLKADKAVTVFGFLAHLEINIDRTTIENIIAISRYSNQSLINEERTFEALIKARDETITTMMPAFLDCGQDETGTGNNCGMGVDDLARTTVIKGSLGLMMGGIVRKLESGDTTVAISTGGIQC